MKNAFAIGFFSFSLLLFFKTNLYLTKIQALEPFFSPIFVLSNHAPSICQLQHYKQGVKQEWVTLFTFSSVSADPLAPSARYWSWICSSLELISSVML